MCGKTGKQLGIDAELCVPHQFQAIQWAFTPPRKGKNMEEYLLISDAAKKVNVESHVLRYWEEELKLPIKRNELGHRYYTPMDIERFLRIKSMKERGLQLKAIKMILKDGKLDVLSTSEESNIVPISENVEVIKEPVGMAIDIVRKEDIEPITEESREEKAKRLQWLLQQLIRETLQENNKDLCKEIRDGIVKEMDYQFRCQEERECERDKVREQRNEDYYKRMDELLRKKSGKIRKERIKKEKATPEKAKSEKPKVEKEKEVNKKRHLSF